jgi:hypothetical protein
MTRHLFSNNHKVGRAVLCAPRTGKDPLLSDDGAHGVTRPTPAGPCANASPFLEPEPPGFPFLQIRLTNPGLLPTVR